MLSEFSSSVGDDLRVEFGRHDPAKFMRQNSHALAMLEATRLTAIVYKCALPQMVDDLLMTMSSVVHSMVPKNERLDFGRVIADELLRRLTIVQD